MDGEHAGQSIQDTARSFSDLMRSGVRFYRENRLCKPEEAASLVCESGGYMADYVIGTDGSLCEVRLDRVGETGMIPVQRKDEEW